MRRFHVPAEVIGGDAIVLDGAVAHRLATVLRLRAGDNVALFDGSGTDAVVTLRDVNAQRVVGDVTARLASPREPRTRVHLYQSITKGERFEWLVEKGTEIGASSITPLITARAVVRTSGVGARSDRWRRIAVEAAEQCERGAVPRIGAPVTFAHALSAATGIVLLPYEAAGQAAPSIGDVLLQRIDELYALSEVSVLIGPEGGLAPDEVEQAKSAGAIVVTLGERVLRSETAGLVALTLTLGACGELG